MKHKLRVDFNALWGAATTLLKRPEYTLGKTIRHIRNSFASKELNVIRWIPGKENLADSLSKLNHVISIQLNKMCASSV